MRLKSFFAPTMTEAMKIIRDKLGEEAIIVSTEEGDGGVYVTAALEQAENASDFDIKDDEWLQYDQEIDDEDAVADEITDLLLKHAVPAELIDIMVSTALNMGLTNPRVALMATFEQLFKFTPLPQKGKTKPIMMVGMPGAGKTLAVAKLATRAVVNDTNAAVITTDTKRAGGVPQLEAFTKLLGVELIKVRKPEEMKEALASVGDADQVLIDTPGLNPFDGTDVEYLTRFLGSADILPVLVLQAGIDADEAAEIARAFSNSGVERILPTRLDIARRLGGVLSAAHSAGMSFAEASHTEAVADGLIELNAENLTDFFVPKTKQKAQEAEQKAVNH